MPRSEFWRETETCQSAEASMLALSGIYSDTLIGMETITQAEFDAISPGVPNVVYVIQG